MHSYSNTTQQYQCYEHQMIDHPYEQYPYCPEVTYFFSVQCPYTLYNCH